MGRAVGGVSGAVSEALTFWFWVRPETQVGGGAELFLLCCPQALSWWPELMVDHAETFLSLYRAHMDAALQVQPVDSWNSFPLFQLLNNFLRSDGECGGVCGERFFCRHYRNIKLRPRRLRQLAVRPGATEIIFIRSGTA